VRRGVAGRGRDAGAVGAAADPVLDGNGVGDGMVDPGRAVFLLVYVQAFVLGFFLFDRLFAQPSRPASSDATDALSSKGTT